LVGHCLEKAESERRKNRKAESENGETLCLGAFFTISPNRYENGKEFSDFRQDFLATKGFEVFGLRDKLEPKFRFRSFLCRNTHLVDEIVFGFRAVGFPVIRSYRCPRSQQLAPNDIPCPAGRQTLNQINQIQSKLLRPNLKLSPCHKFSFLDFNFPPLRFYSVSAFLLFCPSAFPQFPLFPSFFEVFIFVDRC